MKSNYTSFSKAALILLSSLFFFTFIPPAYSASADEWRCQSYARDAVEQNNKNISANCGFTGLRWNSDKEGQKQWCLTTRKAITAKENNIRKKMLEGCFIKKSSRTNPRNQPNIPKACRDPSGNYLPIRYLYSGYRYETVLSVPVGKHGLIQYDFNADGYKDYVFAERDTKNRIRLTSCLSNASDKYQRRLTGINFYADSYSLSSEQYAISRQNASLNISINSFGHNEGSCFANGIYSYKPNTQQFEMIDSKADCSPVIDAEGQPYPLYPPTLPKILSNNN